MNKDGSETKPTESRKSAAAMARDERLKQALRANLHRRKGQNRARNPSDPTAENTQKE